MGRYFMVQEHYERWFHFSFTLNIIIIYPTFLGPSNSEVPLVLKGVQTWEDALEAYDQNLASVVLSNHGGRQLDFARSGIEVLVEVVEKFKEKRGVTFPNDRFQLFVDGGVRRATDVLKAVALGATAGACVNASNMGGHLRLCHFSVGIGRPFLYAFSTYGVDGVDHALQILQVGRLAKYFGWTSQTP
jgi:L-lactate dehydrogenase (cytochrome)